MKQKEIYTDPDLGIETEKMIRMYFAVQNVSGIEGFVYSEEEFLKAYKNSYAYNNFRKSKFYAIYTWDQCNNCGLPFEVIISNRRDLYKYLAVEELQCNGCTIHYSVTENFLEKGFD